MVSTMSNKNSKIDLAFTATENLADEILFKTANTFLEDAVKSIPFASLISGSIQAYTQFRMLKEQKQLLAFIQETETNNPDFIKDFFKDIIKFQIENFINKKSSKHSLKLFVLKAGLEPARALLPTGF